MSKTSQQTKDLLQYLDPGRLVPRAPSNGWRLNRLHSARVQAVLQMAPPSVEAYSQAAKALLSHENIEKQRKAKKTYENVSISMDFHGFHSISV